MFWSQHFITLLSNYVRLLLSVGLNNDDDSDDDDDDDDDDDGKDRTVVPGASQNGHTDQEVEDDSGKDEEGGEEGEEGEGEEEGEEEGDDEEEEGMEINYGRAERRSCPGEPMSP